MSEHSIYLWAVAGESDATNVALRNAISTRGAPFAPHVTIAAWKVIFIHLLAQRAIGLSHVIFPPLPGLAPLPSLMDSPSDLSNRFIFLHN